MHPRLFPLWGPACSLLLVAAVVTHPSIHPPTPASLPALPLPPQVEGVLQVDEQGVPISLALPGKTPSVGGATGGCCL
jgi:hypothetical protein